jgi:hypothetical protein
MHQGISTIEGLLSGKLAKPAIRFAALTCINFYHKCHVASKQTKSRVTSYVDVYGRYHETLD